MAKKLLVDGKAVNPSETVVKFGFGQIKNTTPPIVKNIFRIVLYVAALANIVVDIFPEIPFDVKALMAMYSIKAVALIHAVSKLFGVELEDK